MVEKGDEKWIVPQTESKEDEHWWTTIQLKNFGLPKIFSLLFDPTHLFIFVSTLIFLFILFYCCMPLIIRLIIRLIYKTIIPRGSVGIYPDL
jgi:hypothetical protein